ncbi:hypothetical protein Droror1_Dr00010318 [Drosera rotundifolia]
MWEARRRAGARHVGCLAACGSSAWWELGGAAGARHVGSSAACGSSACGMLGVLWTLHQAAARQAKNELLLGKIVCSSAIGSCLASCSGPIHVLMSRPGPAEKEIQAHSAEVIHAWPMMKRSISWSQEG